MVMGALTCLPGLARASAPPRSPLPQFLVSALLQAPGGGPDGPEPGLRLVHGVVRGASGDEAIGAFVRSAVRKYRGHAVLDTLVSVVTITGCGSPDDLHAAAAHTDRG